MKEAVSVLTQPAFTWTKLNRNTRTRREIYSKLIAKTPEQCHCRRSGVFIVNFEHLIHIVLVFLLLTLDM